MDENLNSSEKLSLLRFGIANSLMPARMYAETYKTIFKHHEIISEFNSNKNHKALRKYLDSEIHESVDNKTNNYLLLILAKLEMDTNHPSKGVEILEQLVKSKDIHVNHRFASYLALINAYKKADKVEEAELLAGYILNCNTMCNDFIKEVKDKAGY